MHEGNKPPKKAIPPQQNALLPDRLFLDVEGLYQFVGYVERLGRFSERCMQNGGDVAFMFCGNGEYWGVV